MIDTVHFEAVQPESPMNGARTLSVCHLTSGYGWGGLEAQVATLLRHLATDPALQVSAILLSEGRLADELRQCGIEVNVVAQPRSGYFGALVKAAEILRRKPVHVLHSHRYNENLMAVALKRWCKVPHLVRTQHGQTERYPALRSLKHTVILQADRVLARYAFDRVVSVSADLVSYLTFTGAKNVVLIRNGISLDRVRSCFTPTQAKAHLGITNDELLVGTVGRLERVKRIDLFLQTAKNITQQLPNSKFLVVGEGKCERELRELARDLDIEDSVLFVGQRNDPYDILRALDLLLICSDHEGLPMVLLEAMALGVPVVSRRVGGIPEVIEDGVSGILVVSSDPLALAQACIAVLNHPSVRDKFVGQARKTVKDGYDEGRTAAETCRLYLALDGATCARPECDNSANCLVGTSSALNNEPTDECSIQSKLEPVRSPVRSGASRKLSRMGRTADW